MNLQKIISLAALAASFALVGPTPSRAETTGWEEDTGWEDTGSEDTGFEASLVYFASPTQNTHFPEAPASFDVEIAVIQSEADPVSEVELFVDGVSAGIVECSLGCTYPIVELEEGAHYLVVTALSLGEASDAIYVHVGEQSGDTGDTEDSGESGGSDESEGGDTGDEEADDTGDESGDAGATDMLDRGCSVDGSPSPWALLALPMLLLIPGLRRRD